MGDIAKKMWNKNFVLLLQGNGFSVFGDILYSIAISFWVYDRTGSTAIMGIMASISMFVTMFGSPIAGAIVDRSNRKSIIVMMDFIRGLVMFGVAYFAYQENLSVIMVMFTAFVAAFCHLFFSPAIQTVLVDTIPNKDLMRGQSLNGGIMSLLGLSGRALSGVLLIVFGVPLMILLNGVSFMISAFSELFIEIPPTKKAGTKIHVAQIVADIKEGAVATYNDKSLRFLMSGALLLNFLISGMFSIMLPFVYSKGFDIVQYGLLMSVFSLSGVVSMMITGIVQFSYKQRYRVMVFGFIVGNGLFLIGYLMGNFYWLAMIFFLANSLITMANAVLNSVLILAIPADKRGMIIGFVMTASTGGVAMSSLAYGFFAEHISMTVLAISGLSLAMIPIVWLTLDRRMKDLFVEVTVSET
ncbi:MAG: MFS transporter [Erysipelotrichaceae bacterium]|nr:MFS transporter [Erysipelotrichaceae bacterium]